MAYYGCGTVARRLTADQCRGRWAQLASGRNASAVSGDVCKRMLVLSDTRAMLWYYGSNSGRSCSQHYSARLE